LARHYLPLSAGDGTRTRSDSFRHASVCVIWFVFNAIGARQFALF
jgi:hypothetical protein